MGDARERETVVSPNGCRWCGADKLAHGRLWVPEVKWHGWVEPSSEQRKARMLARRKARSLVPAEDLSSQTSEDLRRRLAALAALGQASSNG
ncbi:hypothetical protein CNX65_26335 [Actinosynnema pretiosum]|uniref:Uncharacterized protein n=1 Tax=Actinosynnema pretiosum TaxID=42197 RepID=A0A290ZBH9_9PSEU|nr:hypothetical protein CNX65_26335 [Actinosynnema pretiosum]